jgi:hypothetical protein
MWGIMELNLGKLRLEHWYDVRKQLLHIFAFESSVGKLYFYKLTRVEVKNFEDHTDQSLITLPSYGEKSVEFKTILQKIVDFAFDNFQILPSRFKLESDMQRKHLEDMRKIVGNQLGVELK